MSTRLALSVIGFAVLLAAAACLDIPISNWVHRVGLSQTLKDSHRWQIVTHVIRFPGNFFFAVAAALWLLWRKCRNGAILVILAAALSGLNAVLKWMFGRLRPFHGEPPFQFHPFRGAPWHAEAGLSFPSGDASCAFAICAALTMVVPRLFPLWLALAVIVGLERLAEGAHYPSDVVGGAAVGVSAAWLARALLRWTGAKSRRAGIVGASEAGGELHA